MNIKLRKLLLEAKMYQGHKTPVQYIFKNKNIHSDDYNSNLINRIDVYVDDKTFEKNPVKTVDVNKIFPTQKFIDNKNLESVKNIKKNQNTKAYLVKYNDNYYVLDGHHRIASQILMGADNIKAFVQEV